MAGVRVISLLYIEISRVKKFVKVESNLNLKCFFLFFSCFSRFFLNGCLHTQLTSHLQYFMYQILSGGDFLHVNRINRPQRLKAAKRDGHDDWTGQAGGFRISTHLRRPHRSQFGDRRHILFFQKKILRKWCGDF
jgi:hypothetical protein